MAGLIPQNFIDDVLDRSDIVEVVGSRVPLKKAGKNYSACCPFHDEKSPSFTVSPDKQFYYCFGCGAGGNSIGFVMDFERVGFVDAVENLAHRLGLEVPREQTGDDRLQRQNRAIYSLLEKADRYYRNQLRQHAQAGRAVDYLKGRGLSGEIASRFGIGYAPPGWDNILVALGEPDDENRLLQQAGLLIEHEEKHSLYDRFRDRIMFPIRDVRGRTIGFGGRVLGDDKPKYLNSPETPVFHKSRELYGLYEANRELKEIPRLLVVEGYMDVVALAQFGIHNAVATLGTAATQQHMEKLFRYTSEVVFCFDGDEAGRKAASRALETALPEMIDGRSARFLFLPEGEDPDSRVRAIGKEAFLAEVAQAQALSDFLFASVGEGIDQNSLDGKARLSKRAAPMINRLPEGVFRQLIYKQLADLTDMEVGTLRTLIEPSPETASYQQQDVPFDESDAHAVTGLVDYPELHERQDFLSDPAREERYQRPRKSLRLPPEKLLISLLLNNPGFAGQVHDLELLRSLENPELETFARLVELLLDNPEYTFTHILGYWRGVYDQEQAELLAGIAAADLLQGNTEYNNQDEFESTLKYFYRMAQREQSAEAVLASLASQETLTEQDMQLANAAWGKLTREQRQVSGNALLAEIISRLRGSK